MYIKKIEEENNVFGDNIAFVQLWDFSKANTNDEARIEAITTVASICYDNPGVVGKESLYNRLAAEAKGLPSSSFEFVPVLLDMDIYQDMAFAGFSYYEAEDGNDEFIMDVEKYGQFINVDDNGHSVRYLLTNYRALYHDNEKFGDHYKNQHGKNLLESYNTDEFEQRIISENWTTFLMKMDMNTSKQHNRHRIVLQELSRRYVSGKKNAFEFYVSDKMKDVMSETVTLDGSKLVLGTNTLNDLMIAHYDAAIAKGIKPQEARRILPQSMYTTIWSAFLPFQLDNYFALRDDLHAQHEIRWIAQSMKRLLNV